MNSIRNRLEMLEKQLKPKDYGPEDPLSRSLREFEEWVRANPAEWKQGIEELSSDPVGGNYGH